MELPATQAMDDELPPTQQFDQDEEKNDSPVGTLIVGTTSYQIFPGITSIGRHPESKVYINHPTVSKNHATIDAEAANHAIFLKDLESSNKTKINDTRLRPHGNYQIKDGDNLCFGSIVAKFKLFQAVEDSFINCTPQVNKKVRSVIPGTPDSMNASSASEGDVSMIPGTQNDIGCFRRPETSNKTSSPKVPAFSMEDFENSIYSAETQKSTEGKPDDKDESIYELTTQKASNVAIDNNSIEDLETQQCDPKPLNNTTKKTHNVSIYSAETQKQLPEEDEKEDIEYQETQRFDPKLLNNTTRKSCNLSIYSAETQKQLPEENINNSLRKSGDVSIYSAMTQKRVSEGNFNKSIQGTRTLNDVSIYSAETQKAVAEDDSLENLETQAFTINKPDSSVKKSIDTSIYSAETQKAVEDESLENLETQAFTINKPDSSVRKSVDASIYYAETQKVVPDINESIENMETQKINIKESDTFQTPNLRKIKCTEKPLSEMETQKYDQSSLVNGKSLEDAETERFECEKSNLEKRKSEIFRSKQESATEDLYEAQTQKYTPDTLANKISNGDESIDDLQTQQFISNNPDVVINESTDNIEPQEPANPTSIEDMEILPSSKEAPFLNQSNEHISKNVEETSNRDIIDQPSSEKAKSSLQNNSSINNIDISKSAEHDDDADDDFMFSQNLLEDCPFALLPEESQENIDTEIDTSKDSEELNEENKSTVQDNVDNLPVEISNKSNISTSTDKTAPSVDDDSETDEEGFFSNPTPSGNSTKINIEKSNSDAETDEEGVFSSHVSKESENNEINAKNKDSDNTETDEGVFSNPSKSNEKLNCENNESDAETDEEGLFSNSLPKTCEMTNTEATTLKKDEIVSTAENDDSKMDKEKILDNSLKTTDKMKEENNKSEGSELPKVQSLAFKQGSVLHPSPIPDSDDSLFDDNDEDERSNLNISEKSNLKVDKSINQTDNNNPSKDNHSTTNEDKEKTDLITNRTNLNETSNSANNKNSEVDDLASSHDLDSSKLVIDESDSEDECLAPTPVSSPKKEPTKNNVKEDDLLAPTQLMIREKSPVKKDTQKLEDLNLSPTQKMDTQDCTELLPPSEDVKNPPNPENNKIDRNASVEDLDYEMSSTQPIEDKISNESLNSSKRQLEELEITCNKKLKSDEVQPVSVDRNSSVENNLKQMFDGNEEDKAISQGPELLTQQLEDILQSSQVAEEPVEDIALTMPSPTLSCSRKNSKARNRRKIKQSKNTNSSSQEKKISIDLNDTIERNLSDMFNASINDVESYESGSMMTQQLANVLESQDSSETNVEGIETKASPNLSSRLSLNASSSSKDKNKRKSKAQVAQTRVSPVMEDSKPTKSKANAEEPQESEEYFANLKSKKKRASAILDSQEDQTSDDDKELVYKHGILGFVPDIGAIRTNERVALYEPKGRPFTSDSQSEGEDPDNSQRQRRFSLSLSKNVNLNSSLSDYDLESTMTKTRAGKEVKHRRVRAKGTRGFDPDSRAPVESEELVSAPSTEGEEDFARSQQKVGTLDSSLRLSLDVESEARMSQTVDSDEEFLKNYPDVEIAGTADCPPTSSQLAAPCEENDDMISLASVVIPTKNQWYAQKRFDLIYKGLAASAKASSDDEEEKPSVASPLVERSPAPSSKIDEFVAETGKKRPGVATPRGASARNPRRKRGTPSPRTPSGRITRSSSNLGVEVMRRHSFAKEANKTIASSSDSDSDIPIIPKYKPKDDDQSFWRRMRDLERSLLDDEPTENNLQFARLREEFERNMSKTSPSARKPPAPSPARARGRRACALTAGGTLSGDGRAATAATRTRARAGTADEDAIVFQVPGGVEGGARRRPPLAITRSKRTAEDSQNQPPKRAKMQNDQVKLQELSVVISPIKDKLYPNRTQQALRIIDNNGTNAFLQNANDQPKKAEKNLIKFPKPLESYVVLQRTKSKKDNSESLSKSIEALKNKSEVKPTTRRNKATASETTKAETSMAKSFNSSKNSVIVEDSDAESSKQISTRGTRSRRNNLSIAKSSSSKDESSGNSSEDIINRSKKSTRGKTVRQAQKKAAPIKNETIIPDSDQESDESMSKSKEEKSVHKSNSEKEETNRSTSKSTRSRRVKDSDSEKLEVSKPFVNTASRSRRIRNAPSKIIPSQDSDSEFSEGTSIRKNNVKSKKNAKYKADSDSERSTSPEKSNKSDIPVETKKPRNTRRAKAQNSSNSGFSESENDQSKNLSLANASKSSQSVRPSRKRTATHAISSESQEVAEFMASSVEKDINASITRSGRTTKKTIASSSSSSLSLKTESQSDEASDKSTDRSKRARVDKSVKSTQISPSPLTPSESLLTPSRSRRSSILSPLRGSTHKVLFTGDKSEAHKHIACKLGATVIDDPAKCTILVTDKVRRTCKFLCCVARGIPIVSFKWLDDSLKAQHFVDWEDYVLEDPVSEAQYKFNLQESLKKAREQKFLEDYTVLLYQIPAKLLSTKELREIVASSGGKPLFRAPAQWPEKVVIVTTEDKLQNAKKLLAKAAKSVTIQSTEFLFSGILRQEFNLQEFKLSS